MEPKKYRYLLVVSEPKQDDFDAEILEDVTTDMPEAFTEDDLHKNARVDANAKQIARRNMKLGRKDQLVRVVWLGEVPAT